MEKQDGRHIPQKKIKILFVHHIKCRGFIKTDYDILIEKYDVTDFYYRGIQDIPCLMFECRRHDLIFGWFMSLHTFFTTFNSKKKIYVAGGYDAAKQSDYQYGLACRWYTKLLVKRCLKKADVVLSVSDFNKTELPKNYGYADAALVYNSVDTDYFKPDKKKTDGLVVTVASMDMVSFFRKGVDVFVELARESARLGLPYTFVVVGRYTDELKKYVMDVQKHIPNLQFTGFVSDEELLKWYQKAMVYCQLSKYESFGLSLVEAMSCGCIPVISGRAALPEVVGGMGVVLDNDDPVSSLKQAVECDSGVECRKRVVELFSKESRKQVLYDVLGGI